MLHFIDDFVGLMVIAQVTYANSPNFSMGDQAA